MKSFVAATVTVVVMVVIAWLGLMVSATVFGSQGATIGGNAVILGFCLIALVAGTFTYRRLIQ